MRSKGLVSLLKVITETYGQQAVNVGDEGGFAPDIQSNKEGLDLLVKAIKNTGCSPLTFLSSTSF